MEIVEIANEAASPADMEFFSIRKRNLHAGKDWMLNDHASTLIQLNNERKQWKMDLRRISSAQ